MGRRRKRQSVTYDSKETRTLFGLLFILFALTCIISVFIDSQAANVFTVIRNFFGQSTLVVGVFSFNFGLYLFGANLPFTNKASIIAQFMLVILTPAFLTSLYRSKADAIIATQQGLAGGSFGYFLSYQIFEDSLLFAQYTPLILGVLILIFLPLALSMSISTLITYLGRLLEWFLKGLGSLFINKGDTQEIKNDMPANPTKFGDLQKFDQQKDKREDKHEKPIQLPHRNSDVKVTVSEAELGEAGLAQSQLKYPNWQLPPLSLLSPYRKTKAEEANKDRNGKIIELTLRNFNIDANVVEAYIGPSVIQYALSIPMSVRVNKVAGLNENIALALGVDSQAVRIESIPGTTYLGIEVPRSNRDTVHIRELMESPEMQEHNKMLPVPIGKDIDATSVIADVQGMPHVLIAGATGSGKSILTNSFIVSLLMNRTPDELRMILVDPKQVELSDYNGIPHLLTPVITDMDKVVNALKWAVDEMQKRYTTLASAQVRDIGGYNRKMGFAAMPYIVIVIDEMADMMMTANRVDAETAIVRLAQKARAVGIHLVLATQRPSVNVITGLIKANIPARIGMSVTSGVDSRVILDTIGAESLMGKGDLLYKASDKPKSARLQSPYVSQEEVIKVVDFIKHQAVEQGGEVEYMTSILEAPVSINLSENGGNSDDDLFSQAVHVVVNSQKGSSSFLQRKLNIGFNRAARLLEEMEEAGIVGPAQGSKPREVLITDADEFLNSLKSGNTQHP